MAKKITGLKGLATGIGSLPHKEADVAVDLVFRYVPKIPFWPQLPKRDIREGMIAQFSDNFPCLKVTKDGLSFGSWDKEKELEIFYERVIANDIDYFRITPDFALGLHKFYQRLEGADLKDIEFIKCHVTGPFTFAASLKDESGRVLLHDPVFMQVIIKWLTMKALWQIKLFAKFGKKIIIFLDEPYLGCFGSAYTPINREDVVSGLAEITDGIKSDNVLTGVHCCGNTDWSIFTEIKTLDIINFDAFGFLERLILYTANLKTFFEREGVLCWGIVPTSELTDKEAACFLIDKLYKGIESLVKKGIAKELILDNLLLSPSCGLGSLDAARAELILDILLQVSQKLRNPA